MAPTANTGTISNAAALACAGSTPLDGAAVVTGFEGGVCATQTVSYSMSNAQLTSIIASSANCQQVVSS